LDERVNDKTRMLACFINKPTLYGYNLPASILKSSPIWLQPVSIILKSSPIWLRPVSINSQKQPYMVTTCQHHSQKQPYMVTTCQHHSQKQPYMVTTCQHQFSEAEAGDCVMCDYTSALKQMHGRAGTCANLRARKLDVHFAWLVTHQNSED